LSVLNGSLVLLGLAGSFGALFAFLVFSQFRGYNRVSIFLAFFALFAFALVMDVQKKKYADTLLKRIVFLIISFGILIFGLWDQTLPKYVATKPRIVADFRSDSAFVKEIESKLLPGSMIFQLPYHSFPEAGPEYRMNDYDHFRGYLHSTKFRWSYGAMKGRKWDRWQHEISSQPIPELIQTLRSSGFRGLYFDRFGYARHDKTEKEIQKILGKPEAVSQDKRLSFYLINMDSHSIN
jgi:phosphoglycerol transferase